MIKFGEYGSLPSAKESYGEGYTAGRTWNYACKPAGPYVHQYERCKVCKGELEECSSCEGTGVDINLDWIAFCDQSKKNSEEWWNGFNKSQKESKWT